tara:strand:- start:415 stop:753 length:339 start_codon:yes stop_codon:yes gene_type:complete
MNDIDEICNVCLDENIDIKDKCVTQCNHILCKECINLLFNVNNKCPMCRGDITTYYCNGIETRIIYKEKKRVRNIQTIIEQPNIIRINNPMKILNIILFMSNCVFGILLSQC